MLNATDERMFGYFGGAPKKLAVEINYPGYSSRVDLPIIRETLHATPGASPIQHPFVRKPEPFVKPGYRIDATDASIEVGKLDDYVNSVIDPVVKRAQDVRTQAIADLQRQFSLPEGITITADGNGLVIPGKGTFSFDQVLNSDNIAPEVRSLITPIRTSIKQIQDDYERALLAARANGRMVLDQPVAGFRLFKLGGMMPKYIKFFIK